MKFIIDRIHTSHAVILVLCAFLFVAVGANAQTDPLSSSNAVPGKSSLSFSPSTLAI